MYKKENPEQSDASCSVLPPVASAGEVGNHKNGLMCHTKEFFLFMIRLCLSWQARITTKYLLATEARSRTAMAWAGRGLLPQLLSPAWSPSCTHSQELEIFQAALFTTLAKLFIQNIMNVPVVHKQSCLFLSTWNGNFLCSPSGRILHCYYKRWVNPRKGGKTAHVQLSRRKEKRCTNFFWTHLDQLPPMSAAWTMIFVTHLRSIWASIPFAFLYSRDLTSVISFCCTRSFAIQDHFFYFFILPGKNSFKSNSVHVPVHYAESGIGWIFIDWWYRYKNLPVFPQVRDSTETSH